MRQTIENLIRLFNRVNPRRATHIEVSPEMHMAIKASESGYIPASPNIDETYVGLKLKVVKSMDSDIMIKIKGDK